MKHRIAATFSTDSCTTDTPAAAKSTESVFSLMPRLAACALIATLMAASASAQEPAKSRSEIETIVREYILQHPEVLMESVRSHQEKQRAEQQQNARNAISTRKADLFDDPASPVAGKADAIVPVVAFFDYRCGYCKRVSPTIFKLAENPKVRVIFKELPVLGPESGLAARAALAAHRQGHYLDFHRALMESTEPITPNSIEQLAAKLQLDHEKFKADMQSEQTQLILAQNDQLASALGVRSTPSFIIGSELVAGALDAAAFAALIEKATPELTAKN